MKRSVGMGLWIVLLSTAAADLSQSFSVANQLYQEKEYEEAKFHYEALLEEKGSREAFYNYGNCCFRLGLLGEAHLAYQRALMLDPGMVEARQNLRLLQEKLGSLRFPQTGLQRSASFLSFPQWRILTSMGVWGLIVGASVLVAWRPRQPWGGVCLALSVCAAMFSVMGAFAMVIAGKQHDPQQLGIVISEEMVARTSPFSDAAPVSILPPGSEVKVQASRENWSFVYLPGDQAGWVPSSGIELLWPYGNSDS
ncbi:MAG: tetratricopeptide repeat protein [Verrucomicrobiota bacterium]